jgi:hypothetical protein
MKIIELLAEGYPETIAAFSQMADTEEVKKTIDQFRDLVNRNQVQGNERNIDWWRKQGWEKFSVFVAEKSTKASKTQIKRKRAIGQSIILKETPDWLVVIPLDAEASCFHGRGSRWCTARPTSHYFDQYFLDNNINLIYCINKTTGNKWAIASHPDLNRMELFDQLDQRISSDQFHSATGFDPAALIQLIPHNDPRIAHVKTQRRKLLADIRYRMGNWKQGSCQRNSELEDLLIQSKELNLCFEYAKLTGERHGPQEFPPVIAMAAVRYGRAEGIKWIANPSKEVQIAAVKANGMALEHIINKGIVPSESVQIAAVKKTPEAIHLIANPSETVIMASPEAGVNYLMKEWSKGLRQRNNKIETLLGMIESHTESHRYPVAPGLCNLYIVLVGLRHGPQQFPQEISLAAVKNRNRNYNSLEGVSEDDKYAIKFIKNPSEDVQMAAVKEGGWIIQYIIDKGIVPSEAVQMAAVRQNGSAIQYIIDKGIVPSEAVQMAAVKNNEWAFEYIIDKGIVPSEAVQMAVVKQDGGAIRYIPNPSEPVQMAAVKNKDWAIKVIIDKGIVPSEDVQMAAVRRYWENIEYIPEPSEAVQMAAVEQDGWGAIRLIIQKGIVPSEAVQMAAVRQNGSAIRYIANPTPSVIALARSKGYDEKGNKI